MLKSTEPIVGSRRVSQVRKARTEPEDTPLPWTVLAYLEAVSAENANKNSHVSREASEATSSDIGDTLLSIKKTPGMLGIARKNHSG